MTILFLDIATETGWAVDDPRDPRKPATGIVTLPAPVDGRRGHTFEAFRCWLLTMIPRCDPRIVGYEAPLAFPRAATRLLVTLAGITEMVCHQLHVPCQDYPNSTIKLNFVGDGHAKKRAVIVRARQLGWDVGWNDNRADAAAGWSYVRSLSDPAWAASATPLFAKSAQCR